MSIAFLYEHPQWSDHLLDAFAERGIDLSLVNVADLTFDASTTPEFDIAINRINIMPSVERDPKIVFQTLHYLNWLEIMGVQTVNGAMAHGIGASKVMQNGVFSHLGLRHPRGIAIYQVEDALLAAKEIGYPVIVKPNIGGSGAGIGLYNTRQELEQAVRLKSVDLGVDRTGLVQEYIESDGFVYRVEMLGDELFYSIRQKIQHDNFNYCAADGCSADSEEESSDSEESAGQFDFCVVGGEGGIKVFTPPREVIKAVCSVIALSGADLGGVEYFVEKQSGAPCYYDFNPYSNFVSNGEDLLGFSPEHKYIDFVLDCIERKGF